MCLILFAYKAHPDYKLVIGANRDEFYERPTKPAEFWQDHKKVLAGRDLAAGGTWMGINTKGGISLLTNYRDLKNIKPKAPSRGKLVSDFLISQPHPKTYLETLDIMADRYNGYNILLGNPDDLWYYSNIQRRIYILGSGVYGLSNALLDTSWPKVTKGKEKFKQILQNKTVDPDVLLDALFDDKTAPDHRLPETGVGLEKERMLSSMFIKSPKYGTRCSTIVLVNQQDQLTFVERTYNTSTYEYSTKSYHLSLSSEAIK